MFSMTGYGKGAVKQDKIEITAEIKTVNNRYLDVLIKAPKIFAPCEEVIRAAVREKLTRGHAELYISLTDKREIAKELAFDQNTATAYVAAAQKVKELFPALADDLTVTAVLRYPDVLRAEDAAAADGEIISCLQQALCGALDNLNSMRKTEGEKLKNDMLSRMDCIEGLVGRIEERAPAVAVAYRDKLREKMQKLLEGAALDEARLLTEAAIFADKSNIDEELTRLHSHIAQFRAICQEEIVGRKLDFLVQEFNRETNTVCSKANDLQITRLGLALKNEIEKVREQVQNVE